MIALHVHTFAVVAIPSVNTMTCVSLWIESHVNVHDKYTHHHSGFVIGGLASCRGAAERHMAINKNTRYVIAAIAV